MPKMTPYTPRSQMSLELLEAISDPSRMTAQDLARQEEQARVEEFGGIRMPTRDEDMVEGFRKATGLALNSAEQSKLDRAMLAGQWATDLANPGAALGGKAMMPAFKEAMGVGVMPLVTKFRHLFRGGKSAEAEKKLLDVTKSAKERFDPKEFAIAKGLEPPAQGLIDVHGLGIHGSPESWMATGFMDWGQNPVGGVVSQFRMSGGRSVRVPAPKDTGNWAGVINDYEQIGRYVANSLFEDKHVFRDWMRSNSTIRATHLDEVNSIWKRLSPSTPKKDRGGYISMHAQGELLPKGYLSERLAEIDKEIAKAKKIDYFSPERRSKALLKLQLKRDSTKEVWKRRYVEDFGAYVFKSKLADSYGRNLVDSDFLVTRFHENMKKKGISSLKYRNTSPTETGHKRGFGGESHPDMPQLPDPTAVMVLDVDKMRPSYGGRVTSDIPARSGPTRLRERPSKPIIDIPDLPDQPPGGFD